MREYAKNTIAPPLKKSDLNHIVVIINLQGAKIWSGQEIPNCSYRSRRSKLQRDFAYKSRLRIAVNSCSVRLRTIIAWRTRLLDVQSCPGRWSRSLHLCAPYIYNCCQLQLLEHLQYVYTYLVLILT
jgi:hypothetical protein